MLVFCSMGLACGCGFGYGLLNSLMIGLVVVSFRLPWIYYGAVYYDSRWVCVSD